MYFSSIVTTICCGQIDSGRVSPLHNFELKDTLVGATRAQCSRPAPRAGLLKDAYKRMLFFHEDKSENKTKRSGACTLYNFVDVSCLPTW